MKNQEQTIEILEKYNQHHIVEHMKKLDNDNKIKLEKQIQDINFKEVEDLYNKTKSNIEKKNSEIKPIKTLTADTMNQAEKNEYIKEGEKVLKENKFAVVTMAGGQGTRLRT